jgi:hypothetical protein
MIAIQALQQVVFELLADSSPIIATVLSGFGVFVGGRLYLTPAGEKYLKFIAEEEAE